MSQGKITEKQKEILEFIKETILSKGYPRDLRSRPSEIHLFCPLPPGDTGAEWIHKTGSHKTQDHRDPG